MAPSPSDGSSVADEAEARPFVDTLWQTLTSKSFLDTPKVAIAPAAAAASQQAAAAAIAAGGSSGNGPAVVSSYRPPTGPRALQGQQGQQQGQVGQAGQAGQAGPSKQGGKKICFDYHSEFEFLLCRCAWDSDSSASKSWI